MGIEALQSVVIVLGMTVFMLLLFMGALLRRIEKLEERSTQIVNNVSHPLAGVDLAGMDPDQRRAFVDAFSKALAVQKVERNAR